MKLAYTILMSLLSYLIIFLLLNSVIDTNKRKRYFYDFPNGFIMHAEFQNQHLIGYNSKANIVPKINFSSELKEEESVLSIKSSIQVYLDFWFFFLLSCILFIVSSLFFFKKGDILFAIFFLNFSLFVLANIFLLGFNSHYFLFYLCFFQLGFLIVNLIFRLKGTETPSKWFILELSLSLIFAFTGSNSSTNEKTFYELTKIAGSITMIAAFGLLTVGIYDIVKYYSQTSPEKFILRKLLLAMSVFSMVALAYASIQYDLIRNYPFFLHINSLFLLTFPFLFIYSSYRYTYMPQQIFFSSFMSIINQMVIVISFYIVYFILVHILFSSILKEITPYLPYLFLFLIILFSTNLKNLLFNVLENLTSSKDQKYDKALSEMIELIASPISMKASIGRLIEKARTTLDVQKVIILIADERLKEIHKDYNELLIKLPRQSGIWKYLAKESEVTIASHLAYGSGYREQVYNYLTDMKVHLAYPIFGISGLEEPSSVFLFGEKKEKENFSARELRFIKECTKIGDMMLQNYLLLISEIEKKRLERNIELAAVQQKTINTLLDSTKMDGIELAHMSIPAMGVTGDYLDYLPFENSVKIFLGDVSGHGVGSGYLVSAIKALVREQIKLGIPISKLFEHLNNFLIQRHTGNQFMSLVGGEYDFAKSSFEYVNAGHLYPILLRKTGEKEVLRTPDRVIGVAPTMFQTATVYLQSGDRLVIFSDGITETFSPGEEMFGMHRLEKCISDGVDLNSFELVNKIRATLDEFRKGSILTDDISIICLTKY